MARAVAVGAGVVTLTAAVFALAVDTAAGAATEAVGSAWAPPTLTAVAARAVGEFPATSVAGREFRSGADDLDDTEVPGESDEWELEPDESAIADAQPFAMATPIPNAIASPPTRPITVAAYMITPNLGAFHSPN